MRARLSLFSLRLNLIVLTGLIVAGCLAPPAYDDPTVLVAPYDSSQVWAVAPFLNESGVSEVDGAHIADIFADRIAETDGLNVIAVNRVIKAMQYHDMAVVASVGDARLLMNTLDVDGLVVGTVNSFDPYQPPRLGMAVQLHQRPVFARMNELNTVTLTRAPTGTAAPGTFGPDNPVAQAAGVYDAANHRTQQLVNLYAAGRTELDSAYGSDIYLVNMDLYTQFVSFRLLAELLDAEWQRNQPVQEVP